MCVQVVPAERVSAGSRRSGFLGPHTNEAETGSPYWGIYQGERLNGGMMLMPDEMEAPPHWFVYFGIDDLEAATAKIGGLGGTLVVEKMEVPGGEIAVAQDGQGALFGLFAGRFDD